MSLNENNLIAVNAAGLKIGQRFIKLGDSFIPVGSTVNTLTLIYKCASVDTTAHTWTGYKAIPNDVGGYDFATDLTPDLTYTKLTPTVNGIYTQDALISIASIVSGRVPSEGLVFLDDLESAVVPSAYASGKEMTGVTYEVVNGIPCATLNNGYIQYTWNDNLIITGTGARAISGWVKILSQQHCAIAGFGPSGSTWGGMFALNYARDNNYFQCYMYGHAGDIPGYVPVVPMQTWQHILVNVDTDKVAKLYVNGEYKAQSSAMSVMDTISSPTLYIGRHAEAGAYTGNIAKVRIYNRALTIDEINTLAQELTPTA